MVKEFGKVETYKLYIGMNDKEKLRQLCPTEEFVKIVRSICEDFKIGFAMHEQIIKLAEELKAKLNQESIMVTRVEPELFLVME